MTASRKARAAAIAAAALRATQRIELDFAGAEIKVRSPPQSYRESALCNETQNERILRRIKIVRRDERTPWNLSQKTERPFKLQKGL
jgi:hypothetical protein